MVAGQYVANIQQMLACVANIMKHLVPNNVTFANRVRADVI